MGWDISHARRLVPLFDAVERNGSQALCTFCLPAGLLSSGLVRAAYANQMADVIWTRIVSIYCFLTFGVALMVVIAWPIWQGIVHAELVVLPLGWHQPFPKGSFITWNFYKLLLGDLGASFFLLGGSTRPSIQKYVSKYYSQFSVYDDAPGLRQYEKLQFWSSLIGLK